MDKKNSEIRYSHLKVGPGAATCAGHLAEDGESYIFGVTLCSPEDNFNRQAGRRKARKKLRNPKQHKYTTGAIRVADEKRPRNAELGRRAVAAVINSLQGTKKNRWYKDLSPEDVEPRALYMERTRATRTLEEE